MTESDAFTHLDAKGQIKMVDISDKPSDYRLARAKGAILLQKHTLAQIKNNNVKKGNVLACARLASIGGAKKTSDLIPLCHTLLILDTAVDFEIGEDRIYVIASVKTHGRTGAEMEALTAVSTALLCIYDMCKAIDKTMRLTDIVLVYKEKKKTQDKQSA